MAAVLLAAALPLADARAQPGAGLVATDVVRCESSGGRTQRCEVDARGGVRLLRQLSRGDCIEGRTWGWDHGGIWVADGCRGEFEVVLLAGPGRGHPGPPGYGPIAGPPERIRCESYEGRPRHCRVDGTRGAVLVRRRSRAACIEGRSWGWDRQGVWVSGGCRADFDVFTRGQRHGGRPPVHAPGGVVVTCESYGGATVWCAAPQPRRGVELLVQHSRAACVEGRSWGWERRGLWVSHGCRGDFAVY